MTRFCLLVLLLLPLSARAQSGIRPVAANRFAYLDEMNPYYPHRQFPKLITPQWVGEAEVEAVVILAIDDMRDPARYETFLRPILNRLKKIDGRAPVSIMTCSVVPQDAQLHAWLKEGLSFEVHTVDHPCPYFRNGFNQAKDTYDRGVDLMHAIPGNRPVGFRMPCCDSMNTPSPRHWAEIFNKTTARGHSLALDSSVFQTFTSEDPQLPRELVLDEAKERFRKYLPLDRDFVNTIDNYPYPYLLGNRCWQFPCMTPSDWQAYHLHQSNNPLTVRDWKAALDCTMIKKGVFNLVFHPHGWIKADQVMELIDHAVQKHGKKVKFLTFQEAHARLQKALFPDGEWSKIAHEVRLLDVNQDGFLDVVDLRRGRRVTRLWQPQQQSWKDVKLPDDLPGVTMGIGPHFGVVQKNGPTALACRSPSLPMGIDRLFQRMYLFENERWIADEKNSFTLMLPAARVPPLLHRFLDVDGDGICEMIDRDGNLFSCPPGKEWHRLPFVLPTKDLASVQFVDLRGAGKMDVVYSNEKEYGVYLFTDLEKGWSKKLRSGKAGDAHAIPMLARNGTNNGCWVHSGHLWWSNEDTYLLKNHVDRRSFKELLEEK